ncbi:MAG: hypothetical protein H6732_16515 [Alphaproteobacteria bacterium]|nr:hypothetical protein [Alphaproteobacteria bacterium]
MRTLAPLLLLACATGPTATDDTDTDAATGFCAAEGLPVVELVTKGDFGIGREALARPFTVPTLGGDWALEAHWTGCDVYLFVPDKDASGQQFAGSVFDDDHRKLLRALPRNTHVFFFADEDGAKATVTALKETYEGVLAKLPEEEAAHWRDRLHYVSKRISKVGGWLADHWDRTEYGFLVDRSQHLRDVGSLGDPERFDQSVGWFAPNLSFAANEVVYANFLAARQARLDAQDDVTLVPVITEELVGGKTLDLTLPPAATMAGFDTLELDVTQRCAGEDGDRGPREFGTCPAWDYLAYLDQCGIPVADPDPAATQACQPKVDGDSPVPAETQACSCTAPGGAVVEATQTCKADGSGFGACACPCVELGRWITTYHREGRWIWDVSHALATLGDGGTQRLRYRGGNTYLTSVDLRLSTRRDLGRPAERIPLFTGGAFNKAYNDGRDPVTVTIPADATHVELVAVVSGHGFGKDLANCAEFCNHTHHFTVGGQEHVVEHPEADDQLGCVAQVEDGTVPNQFGTWFLGRGGWCPGKEVVPWVFDLDDDVTPGQPVTITYEGRLAGQAYDPTPRDGDGFGARIDLDSFLVIWR